MQKRLRLFSFLYFCALKLRTTKPKSAKMKKYSWILAAAFIFTLASCAGKNEGGMTATEKKNLETAQALTKMFEGGDWSKLDQYIANDAVDHAGMNGDLVGLDSIKAAFNMYSAMMSDMKNEPVKEIAKDDYTYQWMKESWTAKQDDMGMKAGQRMTMNAIEVCRFKDGKVAEHWAFIDFRDMMSMMKSSMGGAGNMPPGESMPPKDTSAKSY
jgi:ketosteroid isomerase-like protein